MTRMALPLAFAAAIVFASIGDGLIMHAASHPNRWKLLAAALLFAVEAPLLLIVMRRATLSVLTIWWVCCSLILNVAVGIIVFKDACSVRLVIGTALAFVATLLVSQ